MVGSTAGAGQLHAVKNSAAFALVQAGSLLYESLWTQQVQALVLLAASETPETPFRAGTDQKPSCGAHVGSPIREDSSIIWYDRPAPTQNRAFFLPNRVSAILEALTGGIHQYSMPRL